VSATRHSTADSSRVINLDMNGGCGTNASRGRVSSGRE
jgi:hypothetical protein